MTLHMIRAELDTARLFELARAHGVPNRATDLGYLVHAGLAANFGDLAPAPFRVVEDSRRTPRRTGGRALEVLGYAAADGPTLVARARSFARPDAFEILRDGRVASKPMPDEFAVGTRLGFEVKICPTVRSRVAGNDARPADKTGRPRSREMDAWLARCLREGKGVAVDRGAVYREWLGRELGRSDAATLVDAQLDSFARELVVRKTQPGETGRRATTPERPAATLRGTLEVRDSAAFTALLRRGVGRHRAFGFGMLLLRPA